MPPDQETAGATADTQAQAGAQAETGAQAGDAGAAETGTTEAKTETDAGDAAKEAEPAPKEDTQAQAGAASTTPAEHVSVLKKIEAEALALVHRIENGLTEEEKAAATHLATAKGKLGEFVLWIEDYFKKKA